MPNRTIYVREADAELWDKAQKHAGQSLSSLLTDALRRYVEETEMQEETGMETITLEVGADEFVREVEFVGRWLLVPDDPHTRTSEPLNDAGTYFGVAETRRGKIAVYMAHCNDGHAPMLEVYGNFEQAEEDGIPKDILAMAAAGTGAEFKQKLDI